MLASEHKGNVLCKHNVNVCVRACVRLCVCMHTNTYQRGEGTIRTIETGHGFATDLPSIVLS